MLKIRRTVLILRVSASGIGRHALTHVLCWLSSAAKYLNESVIHGVPVFIPTTSVLLQLFNSVIFHESFVINEDADT